MNIKKIKFINKEELGRNIDKLRDVLNEICATDEGAGDLKKRLIVSQRLDKLIVKYMTQKNK
jgi:hypothetical protein